MKMLCPIRLITDTFGQCTTGCVLPASCRIAVFRLMMPIGGCSWRPYPELPSGEVKGGASESWGEKFSHFLPACGGRRGQPVAPAGPGKGLPALQLPNTSMCFIRSSHISWKPTYVTMLFALFDRESVPLCLLLMTKMTGRPSKMQCKLSTSMRLTLM